jgi:hypothetical protein
VWVCTRTFEIKATNLPLLSSLLPKARIILGHLGHFINKTVVTEWWLGFRSDNVMNTFSFFNLIIQFKLYWKDLTVRGKAGAYSSGKQVPWRLGLGFFVTDWFSWCLGQAI